MLAEQLTTYMVMFRAVVLNKAGGRCFCPYPPTHTQGTFANVWSHCGVSQLEGCCWHPVGGVGALLNILQCQDSPTQGRGPPYLPLPASVFALANSLTGRNSELEDHSFVWCRALLKCQHMRLPLSLLY